MRILSFDTATDACSAALKINKDILIKRFTLSPRQHTKHILSMVNSLLTEAGIKLNNLNALAFSRGPGNFTGMRIGISVAKGLAMGADLPLIGISTLATLAEGAWRQTGACQVLVAMNTYINDKVYWASYQRQENTWIEKENESIVPWKKTVESLRERLTGCWATAGTAWQSYSNLFYCKKLNQSFNKCTLISGKSLFPNAIDMLPLAISDYRHGKIKTAWCAELSYLFQQEIT
ncbi:tRNA (adenosine(37)-N6)-threonylcarbamoyltransferase complex dimerization subunit type 1 TsaB [Sodalis sp. CWE]|uniref:tRNA (adenosine(37)-N6)-threonylcarbamoyltransferase complex dimerization subunit type 1 TsaB n=1 Tax=Sodalis sp. CWE TaxID=2803816 RepID=UPI00351DA261